MVEIKNLNLHYNISKILAIKPLIIDRYLQAVAGLPPG